MDEPEIINEDELLEDSVLNDAQKRIISINNELTKIEHHLEYLNDTVCKMVSNFGNLIYLINSKMINT